MVPEEPIVLDERGDESHPSFVVMRANRIQSTGTALNDSDILHREYVQVTIARATRRRDLNHDRWHGDITPLVEVSMSLAQWGAVVSSFGDGNGVPVTLTRLHDVGRVPQAPHEPRIVHSLREVREAGSRATEKVSEAVAKLRAAFDRKAGRREMEEALNGVEAHLKNVPGNMAFAAKSLTEHAENVTAKMRADVEGMVVAHAERLGLAASDFPIMGELPATTDNEETL